MIQILGIIFIDDLKITNTLNWNNCTQEIEKQTQQLSRRHLSLRGKAILLNTMILSKVTFPSNVFPLPKIIQQNIEIQVFNTYGNSLIKNLLQRQHSSSQKTNEE